MQKISYYCCHSEADEASRCYKMRVNVTELEQAKQKQAEQARQDSREEAAKVIFDADTLTTDLANFLIDRVLVFPDKRIEIAYRIRDIFD